ncbi:GAP family protein [Nocardioides alcanivorans]|uniref:GAP family protein n=1 Tax=Nocardioides alcanivorans TaxID=2897352 RepID=UPI001F38447F|nr:GAP family protein [Nocardioides alcanivorans]
MGDVVGSLLPVALGVAISPLPIIAVILMLLTPRGRAASVAFLLGWGVGIALLVLAVALLVDPVDSSTSSDPTTLASTLKLLLGVVALCLALAQWRRRPRPGADATLPKWMAAIDTMTAGKACGLGVALVVANPKNLTLCLTAGVIIGSGGLTSGQSFAAVGAFVVISSCSVAVPTVGNLIAADRLRGGLDELRIWLTAHNSAVMTVILLVIGGHTIGQAVAGFA